MRIVAIIFIVLAVVANFIFNNFAVFVLAMFSFPVLLWVLLRRNKQTKRDVKTNEVTTEPVRQEVQ